MLAWKAIRWQTHHQAREVGAATLSFRLNYIANEKSIKPRIQLNNSKKTFGYCTRTTIGYWNVRTLLDNREQTNDNATFLQLEQQFTRYKIDILGVSEARWLGSGIYTSPVDSNVFLYSGKEEGSARTAGVGIMLTKTAYSSLMSWEPISERFITARFRSRVRNISIIQCYAPTEQASNTEKDDFYIQLSTIYDKTPRGDIIMVMDDLNAKVRQLYAEPCHGDPRHRCA